TSRATRVTSAAKALSWSTMVLMVSFSSRISPFTSTVILRDKSPRATAVVTSAMLRTWPVKLPAIVLTESVRSFQVPATPGTLAWPPSLPSEPTSRATRVTSPAKAFNWSTMVLMVSFSRRISPHIHGDFLGKITVRDGGCDFGDVADLASKIAGHGIHRIGEILPGSGNARHLSLAAEPAFGAYFSRDTRNFRRECAQLFHHGVERVFKFEDFAAHILS